MNSKIAVTFIYLVTIVLCYNHNEGNGSYNIDKPKYNDTHNPCTQIVEPIKPDFSSPSRRICEAKYLEYIWEEEAKENRKKQHEACKEYKREYLNIYNFDGFGWRIAQPGEFPHMGAIGWKSVQGDWVFKCGATIISSKFLLTAAHCSKASSRDTTIVNQVPNIVRIGAKYLISQPETIYPKDLIIWKIMKHPNYSAPKKYFDIALIEVEHNIYFDNNVQPAFLWSNFNIDNIDTKASASGWGATEFSGREIVSELRAGNLDIINDTLCNQLLRPLCNRNWCGLKEHQICAGKLEGGVDACQGDSGGPLQVPVKLPSSIDRKMYFLVGITSFGFGCARPDTPGIYTRVASFIDWIEKIVWPDEAASGKYFFGH